MDDFLQSIFIRLTAKYGVGASVVSVVTLFIGVVLMRVFGNQFEKRVPGFISSVMPKKISKHELLKNHILFKKFKYWKNFRVTNVNTDCSLRESIFVDILTLRLEIMEIEYTKLVVEEDYNKMDSVDFGFVVLGAVERTFSSWYAECNKRGIPEFVLKQFDGYIYEFVGINRRAIISLFDSDYPGYDNVEKLYHVFDLIASSEEWLFSELERLLDSFNGEFKNLSYNGKVCKKCDECAHEKFFKERTLRKLSGKSDSKK